MAADDQTYNIDKSEPLPWETGQESTPIEASPPPPLKDKYSNFNLEYIKSRISEWKTLNKERHPERYLYKQQELVGSDS